MKELKLPTYHQTYIDTGNGPTVILLHGLFGNIKQWSSVIEALSKNHRVIVPRLPIFDSVTVPTNITQLVRVLHEFIEWHQLSNVTLVGHAVGGQLALFYANQHPAHVERLVLVSSNGLQQSCECQALWYTLNKLIYFSGQFRYRFIGLVEGSMYLVAYKIKTSWGK
ncbi:MAG: alpha/beta fold hydrolase [Cytophagales bacterium]